MTSANRIDEFKTTILSLHPIVAIETVEEERVQVLLREVATQLQLPLFEWSVTQGLLRPPHERGIYGTEDPVQLLKHLATLPSEGIYWLKDFGQYLAEAAITRLLREVAQQFSRNRSTILLTASSLPLPRDIDCHTTRFDLGLPDYHELRSLLRTTIGTLKAAQGIQVEVTPTEVEALLLALNGMTLAQARQAITYAAIADGKLSATDIQLIHNRKALALRASGILEYFPAIQQEGELGGFATLKDWLKRARVGFSPAARALNLSPPRGICLVGVQGCGKSLAVKAIAREWGIPLLKLDASQLYDKYVGETEKNLRQAIAMAEAMAPVVLWIDEIEKALSTGQGSGEDASISRRLMGYFLTWLQEKTAEVFVVATANDLMVLPPELLRKGRFDEIFFVDLPNAAERREIFVIHLKRRKQDPDRFDLPGLVEAAVGFSGAEIEQAVVAALYRALYANGSLTTQLLRAEIEQTVPLSVSRQEEVEALQQMAQGRFVNVR
jgi:hypothetical protein